MAQIVSRRPVPGQEVIDYTDMYSGPTLYDDSYGDHNDTIITSRFRSDNGGMSTDVASDIGELKSAAQNLVRRRKPILDWKTRNKSFIELHNDLRRLGIKNCTFFLKLYDRDLQGVDPYSPGLPLEMQIKIYLECVINPWYYLREIARVPADGKPIEPGGGDMYCIDRANLASWYLFLNHIDSYVSKPRQCGKTQDAVQKLNYAYHFGSTSSSMLMFNKDLALSKENLARMKDQRDLYPSYLQMKIAFDEEGNAIKGTDNITTMKNPVTGCSVKVMPCATSKEAAVRLGRGYTAPIIMYDEFDFAPYIIDAVYASAFAYSTASKNAIENRSCAARLFLSTPGDLSTRDGKAATDFIRGTKNQRGMFVWNDRYYDTPIDELKKEIYSTRWNSIVFVEYSWQQLKRDMVWFERQCNLVAYNQEIILREVQLQRLAGSSMSPFTREQQLYLSSHKRKPIDEIDVRAKDVMSTVYIYEKFDRRIPYIIGIDPSDGLAEDNNAMVIINPFTLKVAAEYKCPYISSKDFSAFIVQFMDRNCPNALLVVEANRGRGLLERLSETHYRHRIWYDKDRMNQLLSEKTDKYGGIPQSTLARKVQGFITGTHSRRLLFACLEEMVMENIDCIFTENLVNEILTLIRKPPTNKIEAAPGEHDDTVMAYLIALYVYLNASNLDEYGISRRMRAPGQEVPVEMETETQYRDRVRDSLGSIPEKYRGIFQEFIDERDPIRDAHDYAKEIRQASLMEDRGMVPGIQGDYAMYGEDEESFDQSVDLRRKEPQKLGMPFYHMGQNHRTYNGRDKDFVVSDGPDIFTDEDRMRFEEMIFRGNYDAREDQSEFDIDDYV